MRRMVQVPEVGESGGFHCDGCEWAFFLQRPFVSDCTFSVQQSYAVRWFAQHRCSDFPRSPGRVRSELPELRNRARPVEINSRRYV